MKDIKRIDIKEFRETGYLQELNRRLLHPLGLALEVVVEEDGTEKLGGVWDYREDPEGIHYDLMNSDRVRRETFIKKFNTIETEVYKRRDAREKALGYFVEPINVDIDLD